MVWDMKNGTNHAKIQLNQDLFMMSLNSIKFKTLMLQKFQKFITNF